MQTDARVRLVRSETHEVAVVKLTRPQPPAEMFQLVGAPAFVAAPDLARWALDTFIEDGATLQNEEHVHLQHAKLGFCWTCVGNSRNGIRVVGQCEIMPPMAMGKWAKARAEQQIEEWFGYVPDFLITLDAYYAAQADDATFCSLAEHELLHAGQDRDIYGAPKFRKSGKPAFALRGHDVQEFVSIVRRYGAGAAAGATLQLVEAAKARPLIGSAQASQACGTCKLLRAA
jgi:hypothetical protein